MNPFGLPEKTVALINAVFAQHPEVKKVVIYGSRAMGNYRNGSDIDLTMYGEYTDSISYKLLLRIAGELDDLPIPYRVDLSIFDQLNHAKLQDHVQRVGRVFYDKFDGWKTVKLGDVCNLQNGFAFNSKSFSNDEGTPLIRIRDLKNGTKTQTNYLGQYDDRFLVKKGDLLIGMDGEFGCFEWKGDPSLLNQRVCRLVDFKEVLLPRFLLYGINQYLKEIESKTAYITVKHISSKQIKNILFPLPPLPVQKKIVKKLDAAFADIDKAHVATQKNIKNCTSLLDLYTNRLLHSNLDKYKNCKIGDICSGVEYGSSTKSIKNGKIPVIRMGNLIQGKIDFSDLVYTNNEEEITKYSLSPGDVLFNRTNSPLHVGKTAVYRGEIDAIFAGYLIRIKYNKDIVDPEFLNFYLNSRNIRQYGYSVMSHSINQANINGSKLKEYPFKLIPLRIQKKFVEQIKLLKNQMDNALLTYKRKHKNLEALKISILNQAFSGKLSKDAA